MFDRARKALWGERPGFGSTARFTVREDDANLLIGPVNNDKLELRTCTQAWTVEAWVRRGGPIDGYFREFHFGRICGTYDNTDRGVWELYLSDQDSPDGSMAP